MSADAPWGALLRWGECLILERLGLSRRLHFPVDYTFPPAFPSVTRGGRAVHFTVCSYYVLGGTRYQTRDQTRCPRDLSSANSSASVGRLAVLLVLAPPCSLALLPARSTPQLALRHSEILEQLPAVRLPCPILAAPKRVELLLLGILGAAGGGGGGARGANRDHSALVETVFGRRPASSRAGGGTPKTRTGDGGPGSLLTSLSLAPAPAIVRPAWQN